MTDMEDSETEIFFNHQKTSSPNVDMNEQADFCSIEKNSDAGRDNGRTSYQNRTERNFQQESNYEESESQSLHSMEDQQENLQLNEYMNDLKEQQKEITNVLKQMMVLLSKQNEKKNDMSSESETLCHNPQNLIGSQCSEPYSHINNRRQHRNKTTEHQYGQNFRTQGDKIVDTTLDDQHVQHSHNDNCRVESEHLLREQTPVRIQHNMEENIGDRNIRNQHRQTNSHYEFGDHRANRRHINNHGENMNMYFNRKQPLNLAITPFDGKDEWDVWLSRFEAIARRHGWDNEEKLDHLLPRLQGLAGQFVFGQLPQEIIEDYRMLIKELDSRFRVVRTSRSYAAKFSRRNQKKGETAEEYASELKMLYDKAHGYRDRKTRQEDLVRKFLDGLWDEDVRFAVEYQKEPEDIDEAVFHVVNFIQTKMSSKREEGDIRKRMTRCLRNGSHDLDEDDDKVTEIRQLRQGYSKQKGNEDEDVTHAIKKDENQASGVEDKVGKVLEQILQEINKLRETTNNKVNQNQVSRSKTIVCFNCGKNGHIARECRQNKRGGASEINTQHRNRSNQSTNMNTESNPLNCKGPALMAKGRSQ